MQTSLQLELGRRHRRRATGVRRLLEQSAPTRCPASANGDHSRIDAEEPARRVVIADQLCGDFTPVCWPAAGGPRSASRILLSSPFARACFERFEAAGGDGPTACAATARADPGGTLHLSDGPHQLLALPPINALMGERTPPWRSAAAAVVEQVWRPGLQFRTPRRSRDGPFRALPLPAGECDLGPCHGHTTGSDPGAAGNHEQRKA